MNFDVMYDCCAFDNLIIATLNMGNPFHLTDDEFKVLEKVKQALEVE